MNTRRSVMIAMVVASLGTACTAIVFSKVSDYDDVPVTDINGSALDTCSLQKGGFLNDHDANACSSCIEKNCPSDVTYACNGGGSDAKQWFSGLKSCAQNPWISGHAPPSEGASSYGCSNYQKPKPAVSDNGSDTEREATAHNCVNTNCMQGALPDCAQCVPSIKKSQAEDNYRVLTDDTCGSCIVQNCQEQLVASCRQPVIDSVVAKCAYTPLAENKATCLELANDKPDAGSGSYQIVSNGDDAGYDAVHSLIRCFRDNCLAGCQQVP